MMYQSETYICVYLRVSDGAEDIDAEHDPGDDHQDVERQRQFGVFQALVVAAQQGDDGAEDDDVPQDGGGDAQLLAPQLHAAQPRHDVVGQPHVGGQQPAEEHAVDVQRAQPPIGEVGHRAEQFRPAELGCDGEGDDPDDEEVSRWR